MTKEQIYARLDYLDEQAILTTEQMVEYSVLIKTLQDMK